MYGSALSMMLSFGLQRRVSELPCRLIGSLVAA